MASTIPSSALHPLLSLSDSKAIPIAFVSSTTLEDELVNLIERYCDERPEPA